MTLAHDQPLAPYEQQPHSVLSGLEFKLGIILQKQP